MIDQTPGDNGPQHPERPGKLLPKTLELKSAALNEQVISPMASVVEPVESVDPADAKSRQTKLSEQVKTPSVDAEEATSLPSSIPHSVGPYELVRLIGRGGMATVHYAKHRQSGEEYAIKLIRADQPVDEKQMQLFVREASVLTRLDHPRIVKAHEFDSKGEYHFWSWSM